MKTIGLLGTRFTMEDNFYESYFFNHHRIEKIIPTLPQREKISSYYLQRTLLGTN